MRTSACSARCSNSCTERAEGRWLPRLSQSVRARANASLLTIRRSTQLLREVLLTLRGRLQVFRQPLVNLGLLLLHAAAQVLTFLEQPGQLG